MMAIERISKRLTEEVSIAPLAVMRIAFGAVMLFGVIRFAAKGWIKALYVDPHFYFTYPGFDWVKPLGEQGMYLLFAFMGLSAFMMMIGGFYRFFAWGFFLSFTYVELIDKTNYLNHYYFVSIMALLMALLPAHRLCALDTWRKPELRLNTVPRWMIGSIQLQLGMVYFFAGLAKLNYDWLILAQPLRIWLPANSHLPVVGGLLQQEWIAYAFSWGGALYDLTIPFLLLYAPTRKPAYAAVIVFHIITAALFPIGMFPYIMIIMTLVFFPASFHDRIINGISKLMPPAKPGAPLPLFRFKFARQAMMVLLLIHFTVQAALPMRYLFQTDNIFWTEQGYRFSWRVMLMEKAGTTFFYVTDKRTGKTMEESVGNYLTPQQEKMMATQPDMILQFARFLGDQWRERGLDPKVSVQSYVTINGRGSRLYVNPDVDLLQVQAGNRQAWLQPYSSK